MARGLDAQIDVSTNADGSPTFADPDEQFDALEDGTGGVAVYSFRPSGLDVAPGKEHVADPDRSVPWTPEHIGLVFGPCAH